MTLPNLVKGRASKWAYLILGATATVLLYQFTNRYHLFEPKLLEFDWVDRQMPFWPWTVWVYFSEYIIFICAYFGLRNKESVTRYFYSYLVIFIFSILVFLFYPVTFPRADYPILEESISGSALNFLRTYMDQPANCLPSLHVSTCFISSFCFWQESKKRAVGYFIWSVLVSISTMTTKQHYFVDVWTAFLLTFFVYWIFFYKVKLSGSGKESGASR